MLTFKEARLGEDSLTFERNHSSGKRVNESRHVSRWRSLSGAGEHSCCWAVRCELTPSRSSLWHSKKGNRFSVKTEKLNASHTSYLPVVPLGQRTKPSRESGSKSLAFYCIHNENENNIYFHLHRTRQDRTRLQCGVATQNFHIPPLRHFSLVSYHHTANTNPMDWKLGPRSIPVSRKGEGKQKYRTSGSPSN
jgi:hypothetical protein